MKVLQFVTRLDLGGAQECCLDQCRLLIEKGHEVHLLTGVGGEMMDDARRIPGLVVHAWPDWAHAIRPLADARCVRRLARMLRADGFDLLHTHCSKAGFVGRLAARLAGAPAKVVHHIHGWSFNASQSPPRRALYVALERVAAKPGYLLLACSEETSAQGRRARIGRDADRRVLHYGIDRCENLRKRPRDAIRRRLGLGARDVLFLQLGNLKPQKDPVTFARAAAAAGRDLRRAHFWIAGDGPLRARATAVARDGGLGERFRILGWRRDVPDLLAAADVLVLTSRFEGLPLAVLRGMAAGLPVVATAVDGTPEAVAEGVSGFLVPPGDDRAAARAFVRLGSDPTLRRRMGRQGRERSRRFRLERVRYELLDVYGVGRTGSGH
jgi:glycosyltransferase involved in cell wall biosynthesis